MSSNPPPQPAPDSSGSSSSRPAHDPPLAAQVLIIDDEPDHAEVMAEALRKPGHVCTIVTSVAAALEELKGGSFDVIVTDLRMPASAGVLAIAPDGADAGLRLLEAAKRLQPSAEVIMVTAHGDVPTARAAFKVGAYDFIEKPLELEVFRNLVGRAAETVLLRHRAPDLPELVQHDGFEGIVAASEPMRRILQTVRTVAPSSLPVLITGESGTGKELIAQAIHRLSLRAPKRLVSFNCAGQAESLLEDTLFGHVRGAFTGADRDREGLFEYASGGTLFLDEIGDMPLTMQAKLLRVLENGQVVRLGSNEQRRADVRFVSATNKDLRRMADAGAFREDLYFRIRGAHVHLPPLRDRREDIPRIVRHAISSFAAQRAGKPVASAPPPPAITDAAMMRLTAYAWPGNVRQLLNVVQNMVVMAAGEAGAQREADLSAVTLDLRHVPEEVVSPDADGEGAGVVGGWGAGGGGGGGTGGGTGSGGVGDPTGSAAASLAGTSLASLEKRAIRETLRLTAGNREKAAELLGIGERTLYRKLKEYGLR